MIRRAQIAVLLVVTGCESIESVARERAARELACPAAALTILRGAQLSDGQEVTAAGCERSVTYSCGRRSVRRYGYACQSLAVPPRPRPSYEIRVVPGSNGTRARVLVVP